MKKLKIWTRDNIDYIAAYSVTEAKDKLATITDLYDDDVWQSLSEEELNHYHFIEEDDPTETPTKTFREKLEERVKAGDKFPDFFASSEW